MHGRNDSDCASGRSRRWSARALETCHPADVAEDRDGCERKPLHLVALMDDARKIELLVTHGGI